MRLFIIIINALCIYIIVALIYISVQFIHLIITNVCHICMLISNVPFTPAKIILHLVIQFYVQELITLLLSLTNY